MVLAGLGAFAALWWAISAALVPGLSLIDLTPIFGPIRDVLSSLVFSVRSLFTSF
ncbi:MAG: hypothetical protein U1A27_14355 [Phycisphaerae bacterium]